MKGRNKKRKSTSYILLGAVILGILILAAVLVPALSPYSYTDMDTSMCNQPASLVHPFGTDKMGRDILVRVCYGTGISLLVGFVSTLINGVIGIFYGSIAGYAGGMVDMILMRFADMLSAIPSLLYVILILLAMGPGVGSIIFGICIAGWIPTARITRGEILRLKTEDFYLAIKLAGAHPLRILLFHLLPNAAGPILVSITFMVPGAIFTESFLSFVGVGLSAPIASLGTLIQDARSQMMLYPSQMLYPMAALCLLIAAVQLIGTGLEKRQTEEGSRMKGGNQ